MSKQINTNFSLFLSEREIVMITWVFLQLAFISDKGYHLPRFQVFDL